MTDDRPTTPLTPDDVDVLLSAELDGELDGAAADLGLSAPEAREQLAATPDVADRRLALARARDRLAGHPQLDPEVRDRLVARALAGSTLTQLGPRRDRAALAKRVAVAAGSIAAAIALVFGLANLHQNNPASKVSAPATAPGRLPASSKLASGANAASHSGTDFGDVTSAAALRRVARDQLSTIANGATTASPESAPEVAPTSSPNAPLANNPAATSNTGKFGTAAADCTAAILARYGLHTEPAAVGTGTDAGTPVEILVFGGRAPVAYVVSTKDCSLVRRQPLS